MRIKSGGGLLSRAGRMQNGHGDATADDRNRYSTSIAERSNRMLLRSHELVPVSSFPRSHVQCAYAVAVAPHPLRARPHRARAALRHTCRESLDNKEIGRRTGRDTSLSGLEFRTRTSAPSPLGTLIGLAFVCGSRDVRRAGPDSRNETCRPSLMTTGTEERLDIFRQYLPSSAGEAEILGI